MKIIQGDCIEVLKAMPDESVQCCVTSPPYWGLRDYGVAGQIGLEPTIEEYIARMVAVFAEVRRVLRRDGTVWMNLGDAYCHGTGVDRKPTTIAGPGVPASWSNRSQGNRIQPVSGLKPKDLCGIPWRVAFALQSDGWWLRQDIIWSKPNPMPESVTDRCTKSHEYIFLLSKSARYYYDAEAIKESSSPDSHARYARGRSDNHKWANGGPGNQTIATNRPGSKFAPGVNPKALMGSPGPRSRMFVDRDVQHQKHATKSRQNESFSSAVKDLVDNRNRRSVWTIATQACSEAHFATFPEDLVKPCILAGCQVGGVVLDPFFGSGTVGRVATELGRDFIGIELNPEYIEIARGRCNVTSGLGL